MYYTKNRILLKLLNKENLEDHVRHLVLIE